MKKNLLLIFIFSILASCQSETKIVSKYPAQIGNIAFNEKIDDPDFKRCLDENYSFQYYNDSKGLQFRGEKFIIERKLELLNFKNNKKKNGYITIRFLVNCEGKTGMFRVQQMDEDYKVTMFEAKFVTEILDFTKNLNGWIVKKIEGKEIDYYQYLTYKITDGNVSEILP